MALVELVNQKDALLPTGGEVLNVNCSPLAGEPKGAFRLLVGGRLTLSKMATIPGALFPPTKTADAVLTPPQGGSRNTVIFQWIVLWRFFVSLLLKHNTPKLVTI